MNLVFFVVGIFFFINLSRSVLYAVLFNLLKRETRKMCDFRNEVQSLYCFIVIGLKALLKIEILYQAVLIYAGHAFLYSFHN